MTFTMVRVLRLLVLVCGVFFCAQSGASNAYTPVQRIDKNEYAAPRSVVQYSREGWLYYQFVVNKEGNVKDVEILRSSGSKELNRSYVAFLKSTKYIPATLNGEPIDQKFGPLPFKMFFKMKRVARRGFASKYETALKQLASGDTEAAKETIEKIKSLKRTNIYEYVHLELIQAMYYRMIGDREKEESHLLLILPFDKYDGYYSYLTLPEKVDLYSTLFDFNADGNYLADALKNEERLLEFAPEHPEAIRVSARADELRALIKSGQEIRIAASLYPHDLAPIGTLGINMVRNSVRLENVDGEVSHLEFRCGGGRRYESYVEDMTWSMPDNWGKCFVQFHGTPGTKFDIIEPATHDGTR